MGHWNTYHVIFNLEGKKDFYILVGNLSLKANYQIICHDLNPLYPLNTYFVDEANHNILNPDLKVSEILARGLNFIRLYPFKSKNDKMET